MRNGDRGKTNRAMVAGLELEGSDGAVEEGDLGGKRRRRRIWMFQVLRVWPLLQRVSQERKVLMDCIENWKNTIKL